MTEHTKTDGLPGMDMPVMPDVAGRSPLRNEKMSTAKVECNACPVLCQISEGRTGACDRYANREGVLVRVDPVVLLRRELSSESPALVPFARTGAEAAIDGVEGGDKASALTDPRCNACRSTCPGTKRASSESITALAFAEWSPPKLHT